MRLYYSFDSRLQGNNAISRIYDGKADYILDLYKFTMGLSKELGNEIIFYGDTKSIEYLRGYYDSSVCIDDVDIRFIDDLKMYIHSKEGLDCLTIDGDLVLHKNIESNGGDVWFELKRRFDYKKFATNRNVEYMYKYQLAFFRKIVDKVVDLNFECESYINVGLIKFNNQKVKDYFLDSFYKLRNLYINEAYTKMNKLKIPSHPNMGPVPSLILTQYNFACIEENNPSFDVRYYNDLYVKENPKNATYKSEYYNHFIGDSKWKDTRLINKVYEYISQKESNNLDI